MERVSGGSLDPGHTMSTLFAPRSSLRSNVCRATRSRSRRSSWPAAAPRRRRAVRSVRQVLRSARTFAGASPGRGMENTSAFANLVGIRKAVVGRGVPVTCPDRRSLGSAFRPARWDCWRSMERSTTPASGHFRFSQPRVVAIDIQIDQMPSRRCGLRRRATFSAAVGPVARSVLAARSSRPRRRSPPTR